MFYMSQNLQELIDVMKKPSVSDIALVGKAFAFAQNAHKNHARYSGEPYFNHLFATAKILVELGMDAPTIAAGLLHDSIEDVGIKPEQIRKEFGDEILILVEGVTKLGHLRYRGRDRYNENLRRLFVAMSHDLRVLIIKLADRLHNMQTLGNVPKDKQKRIAQETLEIYAPLAYRLGIRKINRELEELSFPYVYPGEHQKVMALLRQKSAELTARLEKFHKSLLKALVRQGITAIHSYHRLKGLYSLYQKLAKRDWDIGKVYDVSAIRIVVPTVEDCYRVLGVIHGTWRPLPGRIKDYIAFPKPNGYRSLHTTVFTGDGSIVEIQIRSADMHREAEYGITAHFKYKEIKSGKSKEASYLGSFKHWLASLLPKGGQAKSPEEKTGGSAQPAGEVPAWVKDLSEMESNFKSERDFLDTLKTDFFENRVFAFTPQGDVVDLPIESSPIDFAYAIHSDIGDHMSGAKVNGKMISLDTTLENGDIVEILQKDAGHPTAKWLEFAKTTMAKKHIRNALLRLKIPF